MEGVEAIRSGASSPYDTPSNARYARNFASQKDVLVGPYVLTEELVAFFRPWAFVLRLPIPDGDVSILEGEVFESRHSVLVGQCENVRVHFHQALWLVVPQHHATLSAFAKRAFTESFEVQWVHPDINAVDSESDAFADGIEVGRRSASLTTLSGVRFVRKGT